MLGTCALPGCKRPDGGRTEILYSFWGSTEQMAVERRLIDAFEKANPDIRVRTLPIGARYLQKVQAMMIGNVAPDVLMVEMTFYDEWASRGVLADLTSLAKQIAGEDPFMAVPERAFSREGRFFAIPVNVHGQVLFVNLDALHAAGIGIPEGGWSWAELLELGPKLSRRAGNPDAPTDYLMLQPPAEIFLFAYGASLFDDAYHPTKVTSDSAETRAAFEIIRKFFVSGYVVPPDVADAQGTYQLFRDGRLAFFVSGRWMTPELAGRTDFEWDVLQIPAGPAGLVTSHGGTGLAVWSGSTQPDAARRFIEFYASPEGVEIVTGGVGGRYVPVGRNAAFSDVFLSLRPPKSIRRFPETMRDGAAQVYLYARGQSLVTRIVTNRVSQALNMMDVPTDQIVKGLTDDLQRLLDRRAPSTMESAESNEFQQ